MRKPRAVPLPYQFYGRLVRAEFACPACGQLTSVGPYSSPRWNRHTARFTCPDETCGRTFSLGILAWPVRGHDLPPMDTLISLPSREKLSPGFRAALRSRLAAIEIGGRSPVNRVVDETANQPAELDWPPEEDKD